MIRLAYKYDSITDFYKACDTCTENGDVNHYDRISKADDPDFRGLSYEEIHKSMYSYTKGIELLRDVNLISSIGGSSRQYKYDEFDGDDLNYDRLLDGFPAMRKRIRKSGTGVGKFIDIYINICELCNVTYPQLLNKAYTAIKLIDFLENNGFRVAVYSCDYTRDLFGHYEGESDIFYEVEVCLKRHEDSLSLGLILTGISPWFFRYHMFKHQCSHYIPSSGLGRTAPCTRESDANTIIINNGECLTKESADQKIENILKNYMQFG